MINFIYQKQLEDESKKMEEMRAKWEEDIKTMGQVCSSKISRRFSPMQHNSKLWQW